MRRADLMGVVNARTVREKCTIAVLTKIGVLGFELTYWLGSDKSGYYQSRRDVVSFDVSSHDLFTPTLPVAVLNMLD